MVASLKSKSDRNVRESLNSVFGRNRRKLLLGAFVAVIFCVVAEHLPTFAQSPLLSPPAVQPAQLAQSPRSSRIQAPAPRSARSGELLVSQSAVAAGPQDQGTDDFSIYPEQYALPRSQPAKEAIRSGHAVPALEAPRLLPRFEQLPVPRTAAEYSEPPTHVYPPGFSNAPVTSSPSQFARQDVPPQTSSRAGQWSGHSTGPGTMSPRPPVQKTAQRPQHVYPDGVQLRDEPVSALQPTPISGTFVGMQEVFAPPPGVPHIPSAGIGGHSEFFGGGDGGGVGMPEIAISPDMMDVPVDVVLPEPATNDKLLWWESDLTGNILRGRQTHPLTLPQALGLAMTEAPELQVLHSDWFIQQIEVDRQAAAFDWTTFVNTIWNRDSTPVGSVLDGATDRLRSRTLSAVGGLRRLNQDGSEFEISQTIGTRSSNSTLITPNYQGNSRLGFEYDKPLLQGAGEDYNTSRVRLAAIDKDTAYDRFQIGVQDHLLLVANTYWTLVLRRGRFLQSVNSWNRAKEIEVEMASRVEVDVTPSMLDRTRSEVSTRLAATIQAEHDVFAAQDALLRLIYGAKYPQYAALEVVTVTLPMKDGTQIVPEAQIETALQSRSEIHESIRQIKSASIRYNVAANEVLPVLDMVLTGYVAGLDGDYDIASAFGDQFTTGEPGVGIGFNFEVPYRNRAAQAAAEQGMIAIKRMKAQLETTIGEVTEDVRGQVNERNKNGSVLPQQWETLTRTKRILEHTQVRREFLADGVEVADLYLENLLLMQSRLESAEYAYLQSQVRFSLADTALLRAISKLDTIAETGGAACSTCDRESAGAGAVTNASLQVREFTHPSQVTAASAKRRQ